MTVKFIPYDELTDQPRALVDSDNPDDRRRAAVVTYGLDKLVYDSDAHVLETVAAKDYGLDLLIESPIESVHRAAGQALKCNNQSIEEWIAANPDRCALPKNRKTGEQVQTPRGMFYVTDMTRAQIEAAGYGFHHESDDSDYLIMGNGTQAFAIVAPEAHNPN